MRIGGYQFAVSNVVESNLNRMLEALQTASASHVDLLVFPECALTGYPPVTIPNSDVDMTTVRQALDCIQDNVNKTGVAVLVGTVYRESKNRYNRALLLTPNQPSQHYDKRALGGWDAQNFDAGSSDGVFELNGFKIGVRICFEVRYPELFRELYKADCDLMAVMFYDSADRDNPEYYDIIKGHLRSRAAENVCPVLSVNVTSPFQEAPTALFNSDGFVLAEAERGKEGLLMYDFTGRDISPSGERRKVWTDRYVKGE